MQGVDSLLFHLETHHLHYPLEWYSSRHHLELGAWGIPHHFQDDNQNQHQVDYFLKLQ